ncbi:hypothetical protein [Oceanicoccus sp. KOV_DT_Chl]|uniref:hypothetical protein n=1 Tax=Oceanicoccus sp. KOV_DT_Chl TaxID=1904639 RepID=UPI000C7B70E7|nr:hypothetical protein [Oceanicoccus sp. KOV_DT_Chl]
MDNQVLLQEIHSRLRTIFMTYQQGSDVAPAMLFRTEGFIEAACTLEVLSLQQAQQIIAEHWQQVFQQPYPLSMEDGIHIPANMERAPVFPSTK